MKPPEPLSQANEEDGLFSCAKWSVFYSGSIRRRSWCHGSTRSLKLFDPPPSPFIPFRGIFFIYCHARSSRVAASFILGKPSTWTDFRGPSRLDLDWISRKKPQAILGFLRRDRQFPAKFLQVAPPVAIPIEFLRARHSLRSRAHRMAEVPIAAPPDAY